MELLLVAALVAGVLLVGFIVLVVSVLFFLAAFPPDAHDDIHIVERRADSSVRHNQKDKRKGSRRS